MEVEGFEEYIVKPYAYMYREYTKFADELVKILAEEYPWFGEALTSFQY